MNCSLFQNFKKNHFIEKPFPHLVIENALPNEVCERLTENYPKKKFQEMNDFKLSNKRLDLMYKETRKGPGPSIWNDTETPTIWKEFLKQNTSDEFKLKFKEIFKEKFIEIYNNSFPEIENIYTNIAVSANSPVQENYNSVRKAHLDQPTKLFTGLYYLRDENDNTKGGDLEILTWKKNIKTDLDKSHHARNTEINNNKVDLIKTIKYKKNTFVIFLNTIESLHGVTEREKTSNIRKFCVLTGTLQTRLYDKGISKKNQIKRIIQKFI